MAKLALVADNMDEMSAVEQHKVMRDKFNTLADVVGTKDAPDGCADDMMVILDTYSRMFRCSVASAYSRIKFNILNRVTL